MAIETGLQYPPENQCRISQSQLEQLSVEEIGRLFEDYTSGIVSRKPEISAIDLYRELASLISSKAPLAAQQRALEDAKNGITAGKNAFLWMNLKTILTACESFQGEDPELNSEIVQSAVTEVIASASDIIADRIIANRINRKAVKGITQYLAANEGIAESWITDGLLVRINTAYDNALTQSGRNYLTYEEMITLRDTLGLSEDSDPAHPREVFSFYIQRLNHSGNPVPTGHLSAPNIAEDIVLERELSEAIQISLDYIPTRCREVIDLRYGLTSGEPLTQKIIGMMLGLSGDRVRQIENSGMSKLRHPKNKRFLHKYLIS